MEPDYNNNYQNSFQSGFKPNGFDDLHLDDEIYEIKSDRINPEDFINTVERKDIQKSVLGTCLLCLL